MDDGGAVVVSEEEAVDDGTGGTLGSTPPVGGNPENNLLPGAEHRDGWQRSGGRGATEATDQSHR